MSIILIVEDNAEVAKLLELILRRADYEVWVADDGQEALQRFQTLQPDLVLLDIMLPHIDGYEVCRRIRQQLHSDVPVIMLSSLDSPLDIERSREVGASDHVPKPFDKEYLLDIISRYRDNLSDGNRKVA